MSIRSYQKVPHGENRELGEKFKPLAPFSPLSAQLAARGVKREWMSDSWFLKFTEMLTDRPLLSDVREESGGRGWSPQLSEHQMLKVFNLPKHKWGGKLRESLVRTWRHHLKRIKIILLQWMTQLIDFQNNCQLIFFQTTNCLISESLQLH